MDGVYGWRLEPQLEVPEHPCTRCGVHQTAVYRRRRLVSTDWQDEDLVLCFGCFQQQMAHPLHPLPNAPEPGLSLNGVASPADHD